MAQDFHNLEQLLDQLSKSTENLDRVSVDLIVKAVGRRSFGTLLLTVGLVLVSPLSGIPGMPTSTGLIVLLISVQLLLGRKRFWLPDWLLRRSVQRNAFDKALRWLRPPARFIDRGLRPRLTLLTRGAGLYLIAFICVVIAAGMPVMELVPFSASVAGLVLAFFGLSLFSHDGVPALIASILLVILIRLVFEKIL